MVVSIVRSQFNVVLPLEFFASGPTKSAAVGCDALAEENCGEGDGAQSCSEG